ncbi:MAG: ATP-binding protein, partial [Nanoarchaeota archaeon]
MVEAYETTKDILIDQKAINHVIGQDDAVEIIKKAANQRRHVLLIGEPGTGKSLLGFALAELLPKEKLVDIVAFPNPHDENQPLIRTMPSGSARDLVMRARIEAASMFKNQNLIFLLIVFVLSLIPFWLWKTGQISDVIFAASIITTAVAFIGIVFAMNIGKRMGGERV